MSLFLGIINFCAGNRYKKSHSASFIVVIKKGPSVFFGNDIRSETLGCFLHSSMKNLILKINEI